MDKDDAAGMRSPAENLIRLGRERYRVDVAGKTPEGRRELLWTWSSWARPAQLAPAGAWRTWLILAGRGFGKTRAGAEWVRELAEADGQLRIALVAATLPEARAVMVEGESGLLSIARPDRRPNFEPSLRRLTWSNGAQAFLYSAAEAESLRGPQHHHAWADEIGKWPDGGTAAWDNLLMGLRLGERPRTVATTTPRAMPLVRMLTRAAETSDSVKVSRGRMIENRLSLAPGYVTAMRELYGRTLTGRQELDGEMFETVAGALWSRDLLERVRVAEPPPAERWRRAVVGVDPPAGASASSDACGIVAAVLADDGHAYVLADASIAGASPERWARTVAETALRWRADKVVAEANNGGAMVESVLRAADAGMPVGLVHATHGKVARAEPVATLYEAGRVHHAGAFPELEDELAGLVQGGDYQGPGRSPDRADALVWALHELMLRRPAAVPGIRTF